METIYRYINSKPGAVAELVQTMPRRSMVVNEV